MQEAFSHTVPHFGPGPELERVSERVEWKVLLEYLLLAEETHGKCAAYDLQANGSSGWRSIPEVAWQCCWAVLAELDPHNLG